MPLVLSQVLDRRTAREARRLALFDAFPHLRAVDFYLTREDIRDLSHLADELRSSSPLISLAGRLLSACVFVPPYAPRAENGAYLPRSYTEVDRALDAAECLRDVLRVDEMGLTFHHVTEWPIEAGAWTDDELLAHLEEDRRLGYAYVAEVTARCLPRGFVPALENVAPVRNDHAVPGVQITPRYETGFCGPTDLRLICERIRGLHVALDVCHLALGYEARRAGQQPRINALELGPDALHEADPPYDFANALETLGPYLAFVHLSGCAGGRKELHEGGIPGEPGDKVDLMGLMERLAVAADSRTLALAIEIRDGHTEAGFPGVETAFRRVSAALDAVEGR